MSDWTPEDEYDEFNPDPEGPQERDLGHSDDDETLTETCPHCKREIAEGAEWCPYCERWVERSRTTPRSIGFIVVALLLLASFLLWVL